MIVVVVGGIGTGKSSVMRILEDLGEKVLSADAINKELLVDSDYIKVIGDNFSGVSSYSATIDGQWVAIDYARSRATINLKEEGIGGGVEHTIELTIKDSCGNTASWQGTIVR